jgi:hypothetical protein
MFYRTNFLGNVKPFSEKIFDRMIPRLSQGKNGGEIFSGCDEKTNLVLGALSAYSPCTTV